MELAALILGILGFLISFSFFVDLALILSVLGLVLGFMAYNKTNSKGMCVIAIILSFLGLLTCFSGDTTTPSSSNISSDKYIETLSVGDTWIVDGQWELTIHSVNTTNDRNPYSEKKPAQVMLVTYSYKNIGYYNDFWDEDLLFFDLEPNGNAIVIDEQGELAYSYPADQTGYAQETPTGATCRNAQDVIAVNNVSDTITMTISKTDGNGIERKVKYILDVN